MTEQVKRKVVIGDWVVDRQMPNRPYLIEVPIAAQLAESDGLTILVPYHEEAVVDNLIDLFQRVLTEFSLCAAQSCEMCEEHKGLIAAAEQALKEVTL